MATESEDATLRSREITDLFRTHFDFVWHVLRGFGMSEAEAEDGVQEVFLVVSRKLDGYEERGAMRAWLFTVARQVASHIRRADQRRQRRDMLSQPPNSFLTPQEAVERLEAARLVERFLYGLDEGHAITFFLSEVEGLSAPEIATALQLNVTTVYTRQRSSRKKFETFVRRHLKARTSTP